MKSRIYHLIQSLEHVMHGSPWYGESIMEKLERIDYRFVNEVPAGLSNSIAHLVKHMICWRQFAIEKLIGNDQYEIRLNTTEDWPHITIQSEEQWKYLLQELQATQDQLLTQLRARNEEDLEQPCHGKSYSMGFLVDGILQHDVYHLGQVALIEKILVSDLLS